MPNPEAPIPHCPVTLCLEKLLASAEFVRAKRMSRFLRFVVEETRAGKGDSLKERQIGIVVFDRPEDWDPKVDNVVRTEARRLRAKLDAYYETAGLDETIRISIPKGGYTAEFIGLDSDSGPAAPIVPVSSSVIKRSIFEPDWRIRPMIGFVSVVLLFFALSYFALWRRTSVQAGEEAFEVAPFASEIGQEFSPAISPDGRSIAYVWDGNGNNYDIYVKDVKKGAIVRLTNSPSPELNPAWSPDGKVVAFLRLATDRSQIVTRNLERGEEHVLTETANPTNSWAADSNPFFGCYGPAWSPDGEHILIMDHGPSGQGFAIYKVAQRTGAKTKLSDPPGEARDSCPRFSPDGRTVAFIRFRSHGISEIFLTDGGGREPRQLTFEAGPIRGLNWTPDGEHLVFSSLHKGSFQIREIGREGGDSHIMPITSTSAVDPSLSFTGGWLAFTELEENWNIWRAPLTSKGMGKPELLVSSTGKNHSPSYSPDSRHIAFVSDRSGAPEIWIADQDGSNLKKLTSFGGPWLGSIRWSPDGKMLVFDSRPKGNSAIFTVPAAGGVPVPLEENNFEERRPTWSQDGQSIYFNSSRSGHLQIWRRSLQTGTVTPIGPEGTNTSTLSVDGQSLFFTTNTFDLWRSNPDGSQAQPLPVHLRPEPGLDWSLTPNGIYFAAERAETAGIFFYRFSDHTTTRVGAPERAFAPGTPSLTISPDGRWLIYAQLDHVSTDIKISRSLGRFDIANKDSSWRARFFLSR